ncbi:MAG: apolipoprotein N-acyltransferase [Acidiferrobacterales bacterium]
MPSKLPARLDIMAFSAGCVLPLAFAPLSAYPVAVLSIAVLFVSWQGASAARAAWRGFLFGLGQFGVGVSWLYIALHTYGQMPAALAVVTLLLFFSFLATYSALVGWLQGRLLPMAGVWTQILAVPALWTLGEWVRGWFLTGFPWLSAGYSQIDGPLAGLAPWLGVYGVGLAVAVSAGLLAQGWRDRRRVALVYIPAIVVLWLGGWMAGRISWVKPAGAPLKVALVQGNVPLDEKWVPAYQERIIERYTRLTFEQSGANLVVWPEGAVPLYRDEIEHSFLTQLTRLAEARKMDILFGIVERERSDGVTHYYNSVMDVGRDSGVYRKHHLVPFGEYLPFTKELQWLLNYLQIPMSDLSAGPARQAPLVVDGQAVGMSICYEDVFGPEVMRALPQATVLANVTEDAWYGDSFAPHQHLEMAQMRALEAGRNMVLATNTGITAIIDYHGHIVARAPQFRVAVLTGTVTPLTGVTPYVRYGNQVLVWLLVVLVTVSLAASNLPILAARQHRG